MKRKSSLPYYFLFILFILFNSVVDVDAQSSRIFNNKSFGDVLIKNDVKCIAQDKKGYIWIGSSNGLLRYDGNNFINPVQYQRGNKIPAIGIRQIVKDSIGRLILFQTNNKLGVFDPGSFDYFIAPVRSEKEFSVNIDCVLWANSKGNVFLFSKSHGVLIFDQSTNSFIDESPPVLIHNHFYWQSWWFRSVYCGIIFMIAYYLYKLRIKHLFDLEKIRQRIARDLHDDMGSTLSTINILSSMAKNKINIDLIKVSEYIGKISDNSSRMMEAMDDILWNINPANDNMNKIIARMREFATNVLEAKEIEFEFSFDPAVLDIHLNMEQRRDLLLIFKEAVNNIAAYSHSNLVFISLLFKNCLFSISVIDNGIGFNIDGAYNGNGLKNMEKRTQHLNGVLNIASTPGYGTSICLNFPVKIK